MGKANREKDVINNHFYSELHEKWYYAEDHPVALLRAENRTRIPWVLEKIASNSSVLDVGCGAGFLCNALAAKGHFITGIDLSKESLEVGKHHDSSQSVTYIHGNGYSLPFKEATFDVVCAMDVLEHVEDPAQIIREVSRVLKSGGLFFFHTFNRNWLSYLIAIKGVEWFVQNTPNNLHVYSLFIKPKELQALLEQNSLLLKEQKGFMPKLNWPFFKMLWQRTVTKNVEFAFTNSSLIGYCGIAKKEGI